MKKGKFKRVLFYTFLGIVAVFTFQVFKILLYDLINLTPYGWGYLAGNIGIVTLSSIGAYTTRRYKTVLH